MKITVGTFKNWIMFSLFGYRLSVAKGKHSNKYAEFWKSTLMRKYRLDTRFFGIILTKE